MSLSLAMLAGFLLLLLTLVSYVDRLYSEMGKFLSREFQENIDVWERHIEPRMGLGRDQLALSAAVLTQLTLATLSILFAAMVFDRSRGAFRPSEREWAEVFLGVVLAIVIFNRLLPYVFFARTRGEWLLPFAWPLRILFYLFSPVTLLIGFLVSIAALVSPAHTSKDGDEAAAVDALIEAGQEEGIIEEEDHDLIRSAVEFGDKVVREVMSPRPHIFAMPASATIEELLVELGRNAFSRVPIYAATLDTIVGIVFAHDLLQITDVDAKTKSMASIARPAIFVPETKKANELLREMQREKQHMRIVIDEYGGVSGLVTIEDLLEEIVGTIHDEHDEDEGEPVTDEGEESGMHSWSVPGSLDLTRLEELLGNSWQAPVDYEATTVAGLVSETAGRIPMVGEVVEENGLRFAILASTDRRIERLRISLPSASKISGVVANGRG